MVRIYKIVNDVNNKVYVGQTARTLKERWWDHTMVEIAKEQGCSVDSVKLALTQHRVSQKDIIKKGEATDVRKP